MPRLPQSAPIEIEAHAPGGKRTAGWDEGEIDSVRFEFPLGEPRDGEEPEPLEPAPARESEPAH